MNTAPIDVTPPPLDSGLICLIMLARLHGTAADADQIAHQFRAGDFLTEQELVTAARSLKLHARTLTPKLDRLTRLPLPGILLLNDGTFTILAKIEQKQSDVDDSHQMQALIHDLASGRPRIIPLPELLKQWSGRVILMNSKASLMQELGKFDFTWFIPAVIKYRRLLTEVLIVSFFIQLLALVTPLFFQVIMDKVLVHRGFTTLDVLAVGLTAVVIFEVILTALRSYTFAHTTSRIDVELGGRLFRHLLALPLAYFEARRVGDSVARVRELENIRNFLTGHALTFVLDFVFSFVFLAVMYYYSPLLTWIVIASLPLYFLVSLLITPILRVRLAEKFNRGAENQSFLVETISGVGTVKSMAVEPQLTRRWDNQLAAYVSASFKTVTLGTLANGGVTLISKLVTVLLLWFGVHQVLEGHMTIGQLIAFNMLSGQVAQPVMRIAQLWTDFQQVGISMQRLGDILNSKTELVTNRSSLPRIQGAITFDQVGFRYRPEGQEVLRDISLQIRPGEMVGIVGRSGSGKSTLTRLVQRLYVPERGRILVDGMDLSTIDPSSLRRQIGVVLQENMLFNRTIRDNIALTDTGAPLEQVIRAAKMAGAHEFISELPDAYDTMVGEHGATLSGGQRQRIAIARALMDDPRILIFDEATSALDYESEAIIQKNMQVISKGRSVIIIAHRLSAVRDAHRIVAMDKGQIVEVGTHAELLAKPNGLYAYLHRLQQG